MLGASTVYVILMLKFYIMQIPSMMEPEVPPALLRRLKEYNIAQSWLSRLNVSMYLFSLEILYVRTDARCLVLSQRPDCCLEGVGVMAWQAARSLDARHFHGWDIR